MNREVARTVKEIEEGFSGMRFETYIRRPFVVSLIRSYVNNRVIGVGVCCVQLPDKWDVEQGTKTSKVRAVKDMIGIPNPNLKHVIAHEVSRAAQL